MRKDRRRHEYAAIDPHLSGEKSCHETPPFDRARARRKIKAAFRIH
jgi:ribosomal protein L32